MGEGTATQYAGVGLYAVLDVIFRSRDLGSGQAGHALR